MTEKDVFLPKNSDEMFHIFPNATSNISPDIIIIKPPSNNANADEQVTSMDECENIVPKMMRTDEPVTYRNKIDNIDVVSRASSVFPKSEGARYKEAAESIYHGRTSSKHTHSSKKRKNRYRGESGYIGNKSNRSYSEASSPTKPRKKKY